MVVLTMFCIKTNLRLAFLNYTFVKLKKIPRREEIRAKFHAVNESEAPNISFNQIILFGNSEKTGLTQLISQ